MTTQTAITLTEDQEKALNAFKRFLLDPTEKVFVLSGYSGCGKSTLVKHIIDNLENYQQPIKLIDPDYQPVSYFLAATTNKAAENLAHITGERCDTIHSLLKLRVITDYKTGETRLDRSKANYVPESILFIDEASFIDIELLEIIRKYAVNSKIVFIGDPAQLAPINSKGVPVFTKPFPGATLTQVVRQEKNNPIIELATQLRDTVNTGRWSQFTPDNNHVQVLNRDDFEAAIVQEFNRPDWKYSDSKVLAWRNATVIEYNQAIREAVKGSPHFEEGDYAIMNSYWNRNSVNIKTGELVQITKIQSHSIYDIPGILVNINDRAWGFQPDNIQDKTSLLKVSRNKHDFIKVQQIEEEWVDLRAAYAQTVNKAQGSTYDKVFIDLDDLSHCRNGDQLARMLYVAVSRARNHVYLTGDLV